MTFRIGTAAVSAFLLQVSLLAAGLPPASQQTSQAAELLYQQAVELAEARYDEQAHLRLFEAVKLWQQSQQIERAAQALLKLAEYDREAGRWQAALKCYRQTLRLPSLPLPIKAATLNALAQLYTALNQLQLAQTYYQQALDLAQRSKDLPTAAVSLAGLAAVYLEQGLFAQARAQLEKARRLAPQTRDDKRAAALCALSGRTYQAQGEIAEARVALEQALALYRKTGDQANEIQTLCWLSQLNLANGQPPTAVAQAARAVQLANALKNSEGQWRAQLALARGQRALGLNDEAVKAYYRSYGTIEMQRLLYLSADALKVTQLAERQAPYRELADLMFERGRTAEAFNLHEQARARGTLDMLAHSQRRSVQPRPNSASETLRTLTERITRLRADLRSAQLSGAPLAARQAELTEAEQRLKEVRWETERPVRFTAPTTLEQTQQSLRPGDVLLEFALGEQRSYVWFITTTEASCTALPAQPEIEKKVRHYVAAISTKPPLRALKREIARQKELGTELFRLLFGSLAARLKAEQRLIIAPDGLLYYLPFETLVCDSRYLLESHAISYVPSGSVLSLLQQTPGTVAATGRLEWLAFGDPILASSKMQGGQPSGSQTAEARREFWSASSFRFPPLPNTRTEIMAISKLFPPERQRLYLGAAMTEEALKQEPLERYARLHFASHSLIDERWPARSGVVLSLGTSGQEDGFLEVAEIAELKLNADLVVLSACQTGRGQLVKGEGVVGLTRAFLYAGARRVAVSFWNVSDLSTAQLMMGFYRHLVAPHDPATALRQAKLELIASGKATRHPFYWASFVLVGKPQ